MENLKLFLFIVLAVVVGNYLASAIVWVGILTGAPEVIMSIVVIVYAFLFGVLAELGLYLLLALVVGAMLFFIYKRAMAARGTR